MNSNVPVSISWYTIASEYWSPDNQLIAVGYFREPSRQAIRQKAGPQARPETIGSQNRRFLDYCEAQGYEVATTFSEERGSSGGPAFAQLAEYLKRPQKEFTIVVSPSPLTLADEAVVGAARDDQEPPALYADFRGAELAGAVLYRHSL